ncbi:MAG: lysophospholipid acyltransferase family protein [Pleomorphochaeta sp.]
MKYIHYLFAILLFLVGVIVSTVLCVLPANLVRLFGNKKLSRKIYWAWAPKIASLAVFLLNYKVEIKGIENLPKDKKNVCYISNHQSLLDICVYVGRLKIKSVPIAKIEVLKAPYVGSLAKGIGTILLDRKSPKSSIKAILDGTNELKEGKSVIIFPEGTRSKTGKLGTFKAGSYKMAIRAQSTIVPLVVQGTRAGFEDKKGFHRYKVQIEVLPPFSAKDLTKEEQKELPDKISEEIRLAYEKMPLLKK